MSAPDTVPLCVDLDGTLTPVDTLHESALVLFKTMPLSLLGIPGWLADGRARLKHEIARRVSLDIDSLPWNEPLIAWLRAQRAGGRRLVLATAADRSIADAVAARLALFDEVIASEDGHNLSGDAKRAALVSRYGERGFDYVGNDTVDLQVWPGARQAVVVGRASLAARAAQVAALGPVFASPATGLRTWLRAIRLHQWVKNLLVFLPAMLAHRINEPAVLVSALLAFLSFGLCASSVYLFNDLLDLASDRRHARKRMRPFAAGLLPASRGVLVGAGLFAVSVLIALAVGWQFCAVLALYYAATWAYSLRFKRSAIVDVMMLAGLYTVRIIAGGAATGIEVSFWLLAFSMFIFLSLAVVKRYAELDDAVRAGRVQPAGRGYSAADLPLLLALGVAAGYAAIVVMALYINSPASAELYGDARPLWLICPLLLYWISRAWLLTTRGKMHDDPIVFAIRDRTSLAVIGVIMLIVLVAI